MAANDKPKLDIPWGTLVPLIAVLAGIIAQYKPLESERPLAQGEKPVEVVAEQDVDARLWQDPLAVARKEEEAHQAARKVSDLRLGEFTLQGSNGAAEQGEQRYAEHHSIKSLANKIAASVYPHRVLLLAVMLDAGPYIEQTESRLRSRQAVLQALSEGNFVPVDGEHIGFVTVPWPPISVTLSCREREGELLLPWESCTAADKSKALVYPPNTSAVFVLWLPAADFDSCPLNRFAALVESLTQSVPQDKRDLIDIELIGPVNSAGLQKMIDEVHDWPRKRADATQGPIEPNFTLDQILREVEIISPRATMSDEVVLYQPQQVLSETAQPLKSLLRPLQPAPLKQSVEEEMEKVVFSFVRTIAPDDLVLKKAIEELRVRNVIPGRDKVVVLTEWDSPYGRSLATTFAARASHPHQSYAALLEHPEITWPKWILPYQYLRGIDGRLPSEQSKDNNREAADTKQNALTQPKPEEATEGVNQSDYLRRLARQLKNEDVVWERHHEGVIRAIGILGSDIYDKLLILRALRPEFPDAIFFTNNYDAHFERRADWGDARNLVIVSSFGGKLPRELLPPDLRQNVAPFRDNIQTSTYAGTLVAIGRLKKDEVLKLETPRIFEISRRGAYDFNARDAETHWFLDWLNSGGREICLWLAAIWFLAAGLWLKVTVVRSASEAGIRRGTLDHLFCSTGFCLGLCVPAVVLGVSYFAQTQGDQEPLAFFSGISIWPSEMLRLIAIVLALHFMIKARLCLKVNECEISKRFCLGKLPKVRFRLRDLFSLTPLRLKCAEILAGLKPMQKAHGAWLEPDAEFSAGEAWHAYLRRNQFWPRFIRVALLSLVFGLSALFGSIFLLFTRTTALAPARGPVASHFHLSVGYFLAIVVPILTFYVVDAIQLNGNFIRIFTRGLTKWPDPLSARCKQIPPLSEKELSRYHDVFFVAERTEAVGRLIWYPLVVLLLIIVARFSIFDNWTWYPAVMLLFALTAMWPVGSALFLRRAAEELRKFAVHNLQLARLANYGDEEKRRMLDELIPELRELKRGAFAPLREQPFIRALVLPSGGLGLLAVALRLFEGL